MSKIYILVVLLFVSFYSLKGISLGADSYVGTYYYPQRSDKQLNYAERHQMSLAMKSRPAKDINFLLGIGITEPFRTVYLDSLMITYATSKRSSLSFLSKKIGYGYRSELFDKDFTDIDYNRGLISEYLLTGLHYRKHIPPSSHFRVYLGGNRDNTVISTLSAATKFYALDIKCFYLYAGRDRNFNKTEHSLGTEFILSNSNLLLRHSTAFQYLYSVYSKKNYTSYSEVIYIPVALGQTNLGASLFYSAHYRGFRRWTESSLVADRQFNRFNTSLKYTNKRNALINTENFRTIISYKIADSFLVGINSAVYLPRKNNRYYSAGIQISIRQNHLLGFTKSFDYDI